MIFNLWDQIAHLSQAMTLEPGDEFTPALAAAWARPSIRPSSCVRAMWCGSRSTSWVTSNRAACRNKSDERRELGINPNLDVSWSVALTPVVFVDVSLLTKSDAPRVPYEIQRSIQIRGARTHNLKNIDLDLPKHELVVITGLSGLANRAWRLTRSTPRPASLCGKSAPTRGSFCS